MKLYLNGHNYKYAAEQMLLTLFPGERPEYPDAPPLFGEDALLLRLSVGPRQVTAHAVLTYGGAVYSRYARAPAPGPEAGQLEQDRVLQRVLKNAFYRAGTDALGREPPWGALTGVRPVKLPTRDLERGLTVREAERRLRELYHVSAPRRRLALDCAQASLAAKGSLAPGDVSLYVGIPFCPTRCAYCSFISADAGRSLHMLEPYLDALCREVRAAGAALRRGGRRVRSVYFGGGTPTTLSAPQLDRLMGELEEAVDLSACVEYTVEAGRPDTITAEKLAVLRTRGCTRVSVNPQTMEDHVLRAIGRAHTADDIRRAWALVREAGFPYANMDLIAGTRWWRWPRKTSPSTPWPSKRGPASWRKAAASPVRGRCRPCWTTPGKRCVGLAIRPIISTARSICPAALKMWAGAVPAARASTTSA